MTDMDSDLPRAKAGDPFDRLMARLDFDDLEREVVALTREEGNGSQVERCQVLTQLAAMKRMDALVSQMIRSNQEIADANDKVLTWGLVIASIGGFISIFQTLLLLNQVFRFVRF
jgi:hypothetical protein